MLLCPCIVNCEGDYGERINDPVHLHQDNIVDAGEVVLLERHFCRPFSWLGKDAAPVRRPEWFLQRDDQWSAQLAHVISAVLASFVVKFVSPNKLRWSSLFCRNVNISKRRFSKTPLSLVVTGRSAEFAFFVPHVRNGREIS